MQVIKTQPTGQHAAVFGFCKGRANADAGRLYAVAVKVHAREVFTKRLAHPVHAVRPGRVRWGNGVALAVKARYMVGAGKHHALHALLARGFVEVVNAQNIGLQNGAKRPFNRHAAHVHNGLAPGNGLLYGLCVGQIGQHHFFAALGLAQGVAV